MSCSDHVLKELEFLEKVLKRGNTSIKGQQELHKKLHSLKQQCSGLTSMRETIQRERGSDLGEFGANQMPPLSLARVEIPRPLPPSLSLINSAPLPNRTPSASDFRRFQTPQPQVPRAAWPESNPDLSQFRVSQPQRQPDRLSQLREHQTPSALDFSIMEKELLELSKKPDQKSTNTSRPSSGHSPRNLENSRMAEALTLNPALAKLPGYRRMPSAPPPSSNIVDDDDDDDIWGENKPVPLNSRYADMSYLCPGPGCHYPRYDIRLVEPEPGSKSEPPKLKSMLGGSSRRGSRKRTSPRKSRKRTPPKRSRTPSRRTRTVRRSKRK